MPVIQKHERYIIYIHVILQCDVPPVCRVGPVHMCVSLQVRAVDSGSPPRYTDHSLTINILDVNDNAPVIESQRGYNVSISEVGPARLTGPRIGGLPPGSTRASAVTPLVERGRRDVGPPRHRD